VKVYSVELQMHLAGVPAVDPENIQLRITRPDGGTDHLEITVAGDPDAADTDAVAEGLDSVMGISVDELTVEEGLEVPDDGMIVDDR
jgi:phenylacetate-CoA ligase